MNDWRGLRDWLDGSPGRPHHHPNWSKLRRSYRRWRVFGAPSFLAVLFGTLGLVGGRNAVLGGLGTVGIVVFYFAVFELADRMFP